MLRLKHSLKEVPNTFEIAAEKVGILVVIAIIMDKKTSNETFDEC